MIKDLKSVNYMDKLEKDITKLLVSARKKQKERERHVRQEEEDGTIFYDQVSTEVLVQTKSLISLLKTAKFQEIIADRFKVPKKKYLDSLMAKDQVKKRSSGSLTQEVLKRFQVVDPEQFSKMLERT